MPERILYVVHGLANHGGTELHTRALAAGVSGRFEPWFLYPAGDVLRLAGPRGESAVLPNDAFSWPLTLLRGRLARRSAERVIAEVRPSLVHVQHWFRYPCDVPAVFVSAGLPVVVSFHDYYALSPDFTLRGLGADDPTGREYSLRTFGEDLSSYLRERLGVIRDFTAAAAVRVVPSAHLARRLAPVTGSPFAVIPHGIRPFAAGRREPSGRVRFAYLGQLVPQKGYGTLLRAFEILRRRRPDVTLSVHGWGEGFRPPHVEGVTFFGPYRQDDLPGILSRVDVGVVPSEFEETFCLVVSEFFHARVPVVASAAGALADRVGPGRTGLLFPPGRPEELACVMGEAADRFRELRDFPPTRSTAEMAADYVRLYAGLTGTRG